MDGYSRGSDVPWTVEGKGFAKLRSMSGTPLLALRGDGSGVLFATRFHSGSRSPDMCTIMRCDTRRPWLITRRMTFFTQEEIRHYLPSHGTRDAPVVVSTPRWSSTWIGHLSRLLIVALVIAAIVFLAVQWHPAFAAAFIAAPFVWMFAPSIGPVRIDSLAQLPLHPGNIVEYAERRLAGEHPESLEERPHRVLVLDRIASIRAMYGKHKLDVVYRIDNPAFFDPAAPHTAKFLAALVRAEDMNEDMPLSELEDAAGELELLFALAKRHAETVGVAHLPKEKRDDAKRAAKVARLAREAATDGERDAAITQLNRVLTSLALYYLPPINDVKALENPRG